MKIELSNDTSQGFRCPECHLLDTYVCVQTLVFWEEPVLIHNIFQCRGCRTVINVRYKYGQGEIHIGHVSGYGTDLKGGTE